MTAAAAARQVPCPTCWVPHGEPCQTGPESYHVMRYRRAWRRGLLTETQLAAVLTEAPELATHTLIPAVTR